MMSPQTPEEMNHRRGRGERRDEWDQCRAARGRRIKQLVATASPILTGTGSANKSSDTKTFLVPVAGAGKRRLNGL